VIYHEADFVAKVTQSVSVAYGNVVQCVCMLFLCCYVGTSYWIASLEGGLYSVEWFDDR
jgi:hypothetical protein